MKFISTFQVMKQPAFYSDTYHENEEPHQCQSEVWWFKKGNIACRQNKRGRSIKVKVKEAFSVICATGRDAVEKNLCCDLEETLALQEPGIHR